MATDASRQARVEAAGEPAGDVSQVSRAKSTTSASAMNFTSTFTELEEPCCTSGTSRGAVTISTPPPAENRSTNTSVLPPPPLCTWLPLRMPGEDSTSWVGVSDSSQVKLSRALLMPQPDALMVAVTGVRPSTRTGPATLSDMSAFRDASSTTRPLKLDSMYSPSLKGFSLDPKGPSIPTPVTSATAEPGRASE